MNRDRKIIFITGTDTGVGKTLLTALLARFLRRAKIHALAIKPFCSGGFADVNLLRAAQDDELTCAEIAPFYYPKRLAPLAAVNSKSELPSLQDVLQKTHAIQKRCQVLLIEGSGGLMVPLGRDFFVVDLIKKLKCDVLLVARNKLGTINHTLLSVGALKSVGIHKRVSVVLMDQSRSDPSAASNAGILRDVLTDLRVFSVPFLGQNANKTSNLERNYKKTEKTLAGLV